ncbi:MAG: hypothetical protein SCARUB_05055 [Candidatus Scalindua rubra]|uniref:Uncharacterized protein n=1 Tax=Candidatus Scalindua rubra TaxID=1872076 RepID=A0A1E3X2K6_9BACT|nr:MAG: hypothetical protein SCARUB_05055 [Candidatus Scalindua rubra]
MEFIGKLPNNVIKDVLKKLGALLSFSRYPNPIMPFNLEQDTKLIITVLPKYADEEREEWMLLSKKGLEKAYGTDEPEYSADLIKEANLDYEGRTKPMTEKASRPFELRSNTSKK